MIQLFKTRKGSYMKALVIIALAMIVLYAVYKTYAIANLANGLDKKIKKGAMILDVRMPAEYETGHIKGSVNINLGRLRTDSIPADSNTVIITCCSHGLRSVKAVSILKKRGFRHVYNGGAWSDLEDIVKAAR